MSFMFPLSFRSSVVISRNVLALRKCGRAPSLSLSLSLLSLPPCLFLSVVSCGGTALQERAHLLGLESIVLLLESSSWHEALPPWVNRKQLFPVSERSRKLSFQDGRFLAQNVLKPTSTSFPWCPCPTNFVPTACIDDSWACIKSAWAGFMQ